MLFHKIAVNVRLSNLDSTTIFLFAGGGASFKVLFYFSTYLLIFHFFYFNYQKPALIPFSIDFKIYMIFHDYFSFLFYFKQQASLFYSYTHSLTQMLPPSAVSPTRYITVHLNLSLFYPIYIFVVRLFITGRASCRTNLFHRLKTASYCAFNCGLTPPQHNFYNFIYLI